jgi:hypothetical protein
MNKLQTVLTTSKNSSCAPIGIFKITTVQQSVLEFDLMHTVGTNDPDKLDTTSEFPHIEQLSKFKIDAISCTQH